MYSGSSECLRDSNESKPAGSAVADDGSVDGVGARCSDMVRPVEATRRPCQDIARSIHCTGKPSASCQAVTEAATYADFNRLVEAAVGPMVLLADGTIAQKEATALSGGRLAGSVASLLNLGARMGPRVRGKRATPPGAAGPSSWVPTGCSAAARRGVEQAVGRRGTAPAKPIGRVGRIWLRCPQRSG